MCHVGRICHIPVLSPPSSSSHPQSPHAFSFLSPCLSRKKPKKTLSMSTSPISPSMCVLLVPTATNRIDRSRHPVRLFPPPSNLSPHDIPHGRFYSLCHSNQQGRAVRRKGRKMSNVCMLQCLDPSPAKEEGGPTRRVVGIYHTSPRCMYGLVVRCSGRR